MSAGSSTSVPALQAIGVRVVFGRGPGAVRAVDGVGLTIEPGGSLGLVGESGSGKTTLGRAIAGLTPIAGGSIRVAGIDATDRASRRRLARSVGMIFQDPGGSLNPRMRLWDAITEPTRVQGVAVDRRARRRLAGELLEAVGLGAERLDRFPHQLSGGQRQRVAIARALSVSPRLLICDEPTSALDVSIQAAVVNLLLDLQRSRGFAVLFISHDVAVVNHVCRHVAVMRQGQIVEQGPTARVIHASGEAYTRDLLEAVPKRPPGRAVPA